MDFHAIGDGLVANLAFKLSTGQVRRNQFGIFGRRGTYGFLDTAAAACWAIKCHSTAEPIILCHWFYCKRRDSAILGAAMEVQFLNRSTCQKGKELLGDLVAILLLSFSLSATFCLTKAGRLETFPVAPVEVPSSGTLKSAYYGTFLCLSALRRRDFDGAGPIRTQANLRGRLRSVLQPH